MIYKVKLLVLTLFFGTLLAVFYIIFSNYFVEIHNICSKEYFFDKFNDIDMEDDLYKTIRKAITIREYQNENQFFGFSSKSVAPGSTTEIIYKDGISIVKEKINKKEEFTDTDNKILQEYISSIKESVHYDIIISENIYIIYMEKEKDSVKFLVKPIGFFSESTNNLRENIFTFRKKPEEVLPKEIASQFSKHNTELLLSEIYLRAFHEPTIAFKYLPDEKRILPSKDPRELIIKKVDVQFNVDTTDYWIRTYIMSPVHNKKYDFYEENISLSVLDNDLDILTRKYFYDIYIIEKLTKYIKRNSKDKVKILSSLALNDDTIKYFDFCTEIVTKDSNSSNLSFNINIDFIVK